jgi:hypothetical protein
VLSRSGNGKFCSAAAKCRFGVGRRSPTEGNVCRADAGNYVNPPNSRFRGVNKTVGGANKTIGGANKTSAGANKTFEGASRTSDGANKTFDGVSGTIRGANKTVSRANETIGNGDAGTARFGAFRQGLESRSV